MFFEVDDDFEALWALRGGGGGLAERLRAARHVAFIYGALDELTALALHSLVRDLARDRHAVTLRLRAGNARGAEDVLVWQMGFAGPVDFARGFPREAERGEVDAALVVAAEAATVMVDSRVAFATAVDGIEVAGTAHRMDGVPVPLRAPRAAIARASRTCWPPSRSASDAADRRRHASTTPPTASTARSATSGCRTARSSPTCPPHARTIDASGMVVMPGGVDVHSHIAGPKVNAARKLGRRSSRADVVERTAIIRSGTGGQRAQHLRHRLPYARLGYTTVVDAAIPPLAARHAHAEFRDTPVIDKAFLVLMGNNHCRHRADPRSEPERVRERRRLAPAGDQAATASRSSTPAASRRGSGARQRARARRRGHFGVTPRQVLGRSPARSTTSACRTRSTSTA